MTKHLFKLSIAAMLLLTISCKSSNNKEKEADEMEENEKYDNPLARELQEFKQTKDPATGTVPIERLWTALDYTQSIKNNFASRGIGGIWVERGPIYDSVGPSNNNGRGGSAGFTGAYTSGRITGFLVDAADPTGNTVFCGGVNGGIWKCTNFTSTTAAPNWVSVNDYLSNMSIVSFCQNPVNKDIMYVATGEAYFSLDASRGRGIYKSIDHGVTWTNLASTASVTSSFKILCDGVGNIYWASRGGGLKRSTNGGNTFTTISPSGQTTCTDIELSSNGKLYASFGYASTTVSFKYANNPATVTSGSWSSGTGSPTAGRRLELTTKGDTIYGVTTNTSDEIDNCYRSVNGGAAWTKMNTSAYPAITNGQGWFALSLAVNPNDANQIIVGSVDGYLSTDGGATVSGITNWVGGGTYVHADHHLYQWWLNANNQSRMIIAGDGGLFYSEDDAANFVDKNQNLNIKQFYSCAIHPTKTNYMIAGAQDNGVHQLKNAGLSYSTEVTGGDGGFVDIDNDQPQYQFGSYTYNNYRRSTNNGASWTGINISSTSGDFINPFDYDDVQNVMFCGNNTNDFLRWTNPQSGSPATTAVSLTELGGSATAFQASPYKTGRLFVGSSSGSIVMVNNSKTTTGSGSADVVNLNSPSGGNTSCIAVGTNDSNLLAVYSNYGIDNLWITNDMGANWTAIDGNLPDMPVRWAVFHPTLNNAIVIGTEAGVFTTTNVNGASTQWAASADFPLVRVSMLKVRKSDNTIIAATYGRGMWSTNIATLLPLKKINLLGKLEGENDAQLNWQMIDATSNAKYFLEYSEDGLHFIHIAKTTGSIHSFKHKLTSDIVYYRVMGVEPGMAPIYSNIITIKSTKNYKGLQINITPNPINNHGKIFVQSTFAGAYSWKICNVQGDILQTGKGNMQVGSANNVNAFINQLSSGMYVVSITQNNQTKAASFIKQ
jgi:hypothetical protein